MRGVKGVGMEVEVAAGIAVGRGAAMGVMTTRVNTATMVACQGHEGAWSLGQHTIRTNICHRLVVPVPFSNKNLGYLKLSSTVYNRITV